MYLKRVPLNIPSGWAIIHNNFGDEDPFFRDGGIVNSHFYNEDLLFIQPISFEGTSPTVEQQDYSLKLGWYPHASADGCYRLTVWKANVEGAVFQYESRNREEIRKMIERCVHGIANGISTENLEQEILADTKDIKKSHRVYSGNRKRIYDQEEFVEKKNRLTHSQVGFYWPVYYEVCNIVCLEPKLNKSQDEMLTSDNRKL
ncbi:MAG: hypothetical protein AAFO04_00955 [Cyanobacteria bacterium J06592_8]